MPGLLRDVRLPLRRVRPREMDLGLLYQALADGQVDLVVGSATDGLIAALDLRRSWRTTGATSRPTTPCPSRAQHGLAAHPGLAEALAALAGRIDAAAMRRMNHAVDGEHRAPAEVAREFLRVADARAGAGPDASPSGGSSATIRSGPPEPPPIFMGSAMTQAPASGSSLRSARFSRPGRSPRSPPGGR